MVSDFMGRFKSMPKRFCLRTSLNSTICEQMILIIRDPNYAGEGVTTIARALGHLNLTYSNKAALELLSAIMLELFTGSDPIYDKGRGKPLGELATS